MRPLNGPGNKKLEAHAIFFLHNRLFSGHSQRLNEKTKPEKDRGQEGDICMILPRVGKETHQNTPAAFKCGKQSVLPAPPFSPSPKALPPAYDTSPSRENDVLGRGLLRIEKGRADQEQGAWR